jgi:hypothetical protein
MSTVVRGSLVLGAPPPRCEVVAAAVSVGLAPSRRVHIHYSHLETHLFVQRCSASALDDVVLVAQITRALQLGRD